MKPALTVEEWKDVLGTGWEGWMLKYLSYHGAAAKLLHEQPFGFTREMGNIVRWAAEIASSMSREPHKDADPKRWKRNFQDHMVLLREVADRIEALLPPEEERE